ncbi:hypothetical protein PR202_gb19512 [Eleusine coracana subsp. coracana]|uniref:asparagine synthase (glutamine-hydrolyzing) n=1 Tax=Eleusine coracana subsp. coracana TaxID=191504 RepID=A0AAV5F9V3_ELECO|nr:hypothetical protein PR202_gb19512 [Eleusine coracana subsp. coracana]
MCGILAVLGCVDWSQAKRARVPLLLPQASTIDPLRTDNANGEIYNHKKIRKQFGGKHAFTTGSDCEVIIPLYEEYGENFVDMLDGGVFAFVLYDTRSRTYMAARDDAIGVNPLYIGWGADGSVWFSSEMKALNEDCVRFDIFPPGHLYSSATAGFRRWYNPHWFLEQVPNTPYKPLVLREAFEKAVIKRLMTDVPFGVLLSGGLDSSLVASVTKRHLVETEAAEKFGTELHSFVVGLEGSPDLKAAREVADYLGTIHHEFHFTVQDGIDAIEEVIYHDETYDVTTIRASTPMFLMARKIKSLGVKMVLSGEGSDELLGGYLYFHFAPNKEEFHKETCRKVKALHQYDCLRANKATSAWGLEVRVPFLDKEFINVAMSMDPEWKLYDPELGRMEKWVMRKAFRRRGAAIPAKGEEKQRPHILYRQKEQFSDAASVTAGSTASSLFTDQQVTDEMMKNAAQTYPYNTPVNKEAYYYRMIFERLFPQVRLIVRDRTSGCLMESPAGLGEGDRAVGPEHRVQHAGGHRVGGAVEASNDPSGRLISSHNDSTSSNHANGNGVAVANGHAGAAGEREGIPDLRRAREADTSEPPPRVHFTLRSGVHDDSWDTDDDETIPALSLGQALLQYDWLARQQGDIGLVLERRGPFLGQGVINVAMALDPEWKSGPLEKLVHEEAFDERGAAHTCQSEENNARFLKLVIVPLLLPLPPLGPGLNKSQKVSVLFPNNSTFSTAKAAASARLGYRLDATPQAHRPAVTDEMMKNAAQTYPYNTASTKESYYYRMIFESSSLR